jgi:SnoaL-like domain
MAKDWSGDLDGDHAHSECYYMYASMNRTAPSLTVCGGHYIDWFERRDGRWAIADQMTSWNGRERKARSSWAA